MLRLAVLALLFTAQVSAAPMDAANLQPPLPSNLWIEMSRIIQPGVVGIYLDVDYRRRNFRRDPFFDFLEEFFGPGFEHEAPDDEENSSPIGTGFLIDQQHIVTNYHVIDAIYDRRLKTKLRVQIFGEKKLHRVEVLGGDKRGDLALLKLLKPVKSVKPLEFGDSSKLQVGEYVAAFGNPYGHSNSMTVGIVSAKGRSIRELNRFPFIQTDASINPGNSGGPLLNTKGYVIGVNTAIDARAQGIGFAIPSNYAKRVINTIKSGGQIKMAFFGILPMSLSSSEVRRLGLKKRGVYVAKVEAGFPAAKAGIIDGDIIMSMNGKSVTSAQDFVGYIQDSEVGSTVKVKVMRPAGNGFREKTFDVQLIEYPKESLGSGSRRKNISPKPQPQKPKPNLNSEYKGAAVPQELGFSVIDSSSGARRNFDVPVNAPFAPIVSSVKPNSPAAWGGIQQGDLILSVNGTEPNNAKDVIKSIRPGINRFRLRNSSGERQVSIKSE